MGLKYYLRRLFLVHKCASCGKIQGKYDFEEALCAKCRLAFDVAKTESCPECQKAAFECGCQPKFLSNGGSLCLRKLFFYHTGKENDPQNRLIYHLKHKRSRRAVGFVSGELWRVLSGELHLLGLEDVSASCVLVNMPRGRSAVNKYGFDQSADICRALSKISGMPYVPAISRHFGGSEQKKLSAAERKKNIKSLMYAKRGAEERINGRYVILFDDIVTTGASMGACLPILRKMGANGVICCSLATDLKNKKVR